MAGLKFINIANNPTEILELTSLTLYEFETLIPYFETAFQAHMSLWRIDGKPRVSRSYTTYANCPLPTAEDRLLFALVYLKNNPLQVLHGKLFGMAQCKANIWLHLLLPLLGQGLMAMGDRPCRTVTDLANRLNIVMDDAESLVLSSDLPDIPTHTKLPEGSPLFAMMEQNDASCVQKTLMNRRSFIAARRNATL